MNDHELTLFKEYVAEWIEKDKDIKEYQTKIKQLQDNKTNNLMPKIVEFMKNNGNC